jgi:hypothetical protein
MSTKVQNYLKEKITWKSGPEPLYPYRAEYEGEQCLIRINNFPDDHLYTLMVNDNGQRSRSGALRRLAAMLDPAVKGYTEQSQQFPM